ncbi:hypothetical protein KFL01_00010 [Kocuria flava]|uniref:Uncharacterized protein n=1 Tax=Kocuria flava TaxID=446860 RepID=A0ABQ0X088_9MICC|nr:hypothetical protein KFL01_00010 [Kocuria flava]
MQDRPLLAPQGAPHGRAGDDDVGRCRLGTGLEHVGLRHPETDEQPVEAQQGVDPKGIRSLQEDITFFSTF